MTYKELMAAQAMLKESVLTKLRQVKADGVLTNQIAPNVFTVPLKAVKGSERHTLNVLEYNEVMQLQTIVSMCEKRELSAMLAYMKKVYDTGVISTDVSGVRSSHPCSRTIRAALGGILTEIEYM